jgi:predicted phage tail protein
VVVYTIEDATEDSDRRVNGTINFTVTDVPAEVTQPQREGGSDIGGDGTATIRFTAPATNGKDITAYEVRNVQTDTVTTGCTAGAPCTITGLTNGTPYQFVARAINVNGAGPWSTNASDQITPYGTPAAPAPTLTVIDPWAPGGAVQASWPAVAGTGGQTTYHWTASNGASGNTQGTTTGQITGLGAGSYTVEVYAQNTGGKSSTPATSNAGAITAQAAPPAPGQPSTSVNSGTAPGSITWSWGGVSASPGGTDHLSYEVSVNGGAPVNVGSVTSYTRTGLAVGSYTLTVRAMNKGGASGSSAASPPGNIAHVSNGAVTVNGACVMTSDNWYAYVDTCATYFNAGEPIQVYCAGTREGVWWWLLNGTNYGWHFIKVSDTNRPLNSGPDCGSV